MSYSLKRRLVIRMVAFQGFVLTAVVALLFVSGHIFDFSSVDSTIETLGAAVMRDPSGGLVMRPTDELDVMREAAPDLWFRIRDKKGNELTEGPIPTYYSNFGSALDTIGQARFGWSIGDDFGLPTARVRWVDSRAGKVQILTGTETPWPTRMVILGALLNFLWTILPILAIMGLAVLVVTPWVVRGALSGLGLAAAEAERIDIHQRGVQLPADNVPREIVPLVKAVNDALGRLDRGYERHKRFLTDAAHELRTPVAILAARIAALPPSPEKARLLQDTARLSTLTDQLLDLQRLDRQNESFGPVDLVDVARTVVVDLAPIAFAAGYEMDFDAEGTSIMVSADRTAIERAVMNLVQNAIEHGGNAGRIRVGVRAPAMIEVSDEGDGVPPEERERIFEPFHRLRPQNHGAGLGLNLVREIMQLHGGHIELADDVASGACFRMVFKPLAA